MQVSKRYQSYEEESTTHGFEEGQSSSSELDAEGDLEVKEEETPDRLSTPKVVHRIGTPKSSNRGRAQFSVRSPSKKQDSATQTPLNLFYGSVIVVILLTVIAGYSFCTDSRKLCAFEGLRDRRPTQPNKVWNALQKGIEGLLNKEATRPSVFLFLHHDIALKKLIDDIVAEASGCFGGPNQLIQMSKEDFGSGPDDHGLAIERFKEKIKDGRKVFIIVNLNDIAPNKARALHTICDTYSPLLKDALIFLTLRTLKTSDVTNSVQLATDTLYNLWGKELKDFELDPLITRVTDQVLHLIS